MSGYDWAILVGLGTTWAGVMAWAGPRWRANAERTPKIIHAGGLRITDPPQGFHPDEELAPRTTGLSAARPAGRNEATICKLRGQLREIRNVLDCPEGGELHAITVLTRDITRYKRAEEARNAQTH